MKNTIAIIGLGYVGLPLAISFSKKARVIGYDLNPEKIEKYKSNIDVTNEVGNQALKESSIYFTSDSMKIKEADFIIVAVPTPVDKHNNPDLSAITSASKTVGENLKKGAIVIYESTVYPGVTEEICIPILEKESGMKCGVDFKVGYSPERINPGDKIHRLETITKIVSAIDEEALEKIAKLYCLVIQEGIYKAPSIKVAEAAKVIENTQRDINIAFINELSIIFSKMGIDTLEVLKAASTKWNFLNFRPGLVGGHCIGVDPYYLTYKAQELGYSPEVILSGRRINDYMGKYIAENLVKQLIKNNSPVLNANVLIMGLTFKENVPDVRNTKVIDIIRELEEYQVKVSVCDPHANSEEVYKEYGIKLVDYNTIQNIDALILSVQHDEFRRYTLSQLKQKFANNRNIFFDIKGMFEKKDAEKIGLSYWRL